MTTQMTWTDAGFAALVNAEHNGTLPVWCKYIALGASTTAADAEDTGLEDEIKRIETISGTVVDNNVIHVVLRDESSDAHTATEIGLIDDNGTPLARYAQSTPLVTKAADAVALLAVDASLTNVDATQITFGDITFTNPPWGESTPGVVQKATQAQAEEADNNSTGMTPRRTLQLLRSDTAQASNAERGAVKLATAQQAEDGQEDNTVITPKILFNFVKNKIIPAGYTYIQYPGEQTPAILFGFGHWSLLFDEESVFFRTEGGMQRFLNLAFKMMQYET